MSDLRKQLRQANKQSIKYARDMKAWSQKRRAFINSYGQEHAQTLRNVVKALNMDVNVHVSATSAAIQNWEMQNPAPVKPILPLKYLQDEYAKERMVYIMGGHYGKLTRGELNKIVKFGLGDGTWLQSLHNLSLGPPEARLAEAELQRREEAQRSKWQSWLAQM